MMRSFRGADDIELLSNTLAQAESLLHSLKREAGSIGLYVDAEETEFMWFKQRGDISILNDRSLKLVDKFTFNIYIYICNYIYVCVCVCVCVIDKSIKSIFKNIFPILKL